MSDLIRWVNDTDLTDEPALRNIALPAGVTLGDLCDAATDYLWRASGSRYDAQEVTIRPSRLAEGCGCPLAGSQAALAYSGGDGGFGLRACMCDPGNELLLTGPASDITVIVDGVELADTEFILVDGYRLIRVGHSWPCCQNLGQPDGALGTWSVRHILGIDPPPLGRLAARELVIQLALYHSGKESRLPKGTTSITRTGISIQLRQPTRRDAGEAGTTGLPTVELFLDAVNPHRNQRAPQVASPDTLVGGRIS